MVRLADGQTADVHGALARPLRAVLEEVGGKLNLKLGSNQIAYFTFNGKRYDIDTRIGDIEGLTDGDVVHLTIETRAG